MNLAKQIKEMPIGQRRAGKAIVAFFALMAAFTLLSRGLTSFSVARVTSGAPSRGALTHEITLYGTAELLGETACSLPEGFAVKELLIREGSAVAAGDIVAVLDTEYLTRQLEAARRSLEDAQLAAAAKNIREQSAAQNTVEEAQLKLERANEDALALVEAAKQNTARASSELRQASRARRNLYDSGDYTDAEYEAATHDIQMRELALEEAELAEEKAKTDGERLIEDARRAIEEASRENERQARANAAQAEAGRLEAGRDSLSIAEKQERIAGLEALLEAEGKVAAENAGLVTALNVKAGDVTGPGGAYLLAGQGNGSLFTASASKGEAERLAAGDRVELVFAGLREPLSAAVAAVRSPENEGGSYTVEVLLPNAGLQDGAAGTLRAVKRQGEGLLLPLSALYSEGSENRGYVFVLRERETTMGLQTTVERLDVEIIERGDNMAAVNAAFSPDDRIVTASSRPLSHGDRVRQERAA